MEPAQEDFMSILQKRKRNLTKKLDRIKLKEAEVKASGKEVKGEERKMLDSKSQTEDYLAEVEKIIELCKHPQPEAPKEVQPVQLKVEEDRSVDAVNLWALGEFLKHPDIQEKFKQENPDESNLDSFLQFHNSSRGQAGDRFSAILADLQKSVKDYLNKSEEVAPGTLNTYKNLYEFAERAQRWCESQICPEEPVKPELSLETTEVHHHIAQQNTQPSESVQVQEPEKIPEPVSVEVEEEQPKPEEEKVIIETGAIPITSKWAESDEEGEEEEEPSKQEELKEETKKVDPEDEGFVEVGRKKPKRQPPPPTESERPRGRGFRRGRGERRPRRPRG